MILTFIQIAHAIHVCLDAWRLGPIDWAYRAIVNRIRLAAGRTLLLQVCNRHAPFASIGASMAHEQVMTLLEKAGSFIERVDGVRAAVGIGMPLCEIEECLDWLDLVRPRTHAASD